MAGLNDLVEVAKKLGAAVVVAHSIRRVKHFQLLRLALLGRRLADIEWLFAMGVPVAYNSPPSVVGERLRERFKEHSNA
ncbi:MAG: hypothetical protein KDA92_05620 [Planctomycetales bacterium]|nr:hypothetical protein [Planctomycetales bacterium]